MKNILTTPKNYKALQWLTLVLLTAILAVALYSLTRNFEIMKLNGEMRMSLRRQSLNRNLSPAQIRGWMTFRYINTVFRLPADYLKNGLNITDPRYPNLSIDSLAKAQKTDSKPLLAKTVGLIKSFIPVP